MMATADDVTFQVEGFVRRPGSEDPRIWDDLHGDGLRLFVFQLPPDLPTSPADLDPLRSYYRVQLRAAGCGLLEVERVRVDGVAAVRTLIKAPQAPQGRTYVGSLTVPFRDFSFVLKVQCLEHGPTGFRDAAVFGQEVSAGTVTMTPAGEARGWLVDPYDSNAIDPMTRNRSELEIHDAQFPDHPLSRARRVLRELEATTRLSDACKRAPPFVGPRR